MEEGLSEWEPGEILQVLVKEQIRDQNYSQDILIEKYPQEKNQRLTMGFSAYGFILFLWINMYQMAWN